MRHKAVLLPSYIYYMKAESCQTIILRNSRLGHLSRIRVNIILLLFQNVPRLVWIKVLSLRIHLYRLGLSIIRILWENAEGFFHWTWSVSRTQSQIYIYKLIFIVKDKGIFAKGQGKVGK